MTSGPVPEPRMRYRGLVIGAACPLAGVAIMSVPHRLLGPLWGYPVVLMLLAMAFVGVGLYFVDYAAYMRAWREIQDSRDDS